jgi:Phage major capsid protein E
MPEIIDLYDTYTLLMAIQKIPKSNFFLRDTFFPRRDFSPTEHVQIDFRKQQRLAAKWVDKNVGPQVIERQGFDTRDFIAPEIGGTRILTVDDIIRRYIGEAPYTAKRPVDRAAEIINTDLLELDTFVGRAEEVMASQVLLTGAVNGYLPAVGGDILVQINFAAALGQSINNITPTGPWSTTGDPIKDLTNAHYQVAQQSTIWPNIVVMDPTAANLFMENPQITKVVQAMRGDSGNQVAIIKPDKINDSTYFLGHLREPSLDIYVYADWYINEAGSSVPFLPAGTVIVGNNNSSNLLYYGAITLWQGDPASGSFETYVDTPRVPRVFADIKPSKRFLEMYSRVLTVPQDLTEWAVITVS